MTDEEREFWEDSIDEVELSDDAVGEIGIGVEDIIELEEDNG